MPRHIEHSQLEPIERQVADLHRGGATNSVIGYLCEINTEHVGQILKRPRVARYCMQLAALAGEDMQPMIKRVEEAYEETATRAFEVEREVMERLFSVEDEHKDWVKAQLGAATTAQDILDRAGKRAPSRVEQRVTYDVPPATVEALGRIFADLGASTIDVTPSREPGNSDSRNLRESDSRNERIDVHAEGEE